MTLQQYRELDWQSQDEAYWAWCDAHDLDHTDPDTKQVFIDELAALTAGLTVCSL